MGSILNRAIPLDPNALSMIPRIYITHIMKYLKV